jgi:hypothetical protein
MHSVAFQAVLDCDELRLGRTDLRAQRHAAPERGRRSRAARRFSRIPLDVEQHPINT